MRSLRPLLALPLLLSACSAHLTARGLDAVTAPGVPVRIRAKFERAGVDVARERVRFTIQERTITDLTDLDGVGQATVTLPRAGVYGFRARLPERERSETAARLFVVDKPVVVVDIDGTLSNAGLVQAAVRGGKAETFPGAPELLRELAKRYGIVYLTARDDVFDQKTRAFLRLHAFPEGPVLFNDWGLRTPEEREQLLPSQHGKFKRRVLERLLQRKLTIAFGIGDKPTDAEAYTGAGVWSFRRTDDPGAPQGKAVEFASYAQLRQLLVQRKLLAE